MTTKSMTRTQLARLYKVNYTTFKKWLELIPGFVLEKRQRTLTPKQMKKIIEHLGEP